MKKLFVAALALVCLSAFTASAESYTYKKGYRGNIGLGLSNFQGQKILEDDFINIETNHGYSFGNGLYVGGGISVYTYGAVAANETYGMMPLYGEVKYNFPNFIVSPFVDARVGLNTVVYSNGDNVSGEYGFLFSPMVGVDIWRFSLAFYYQINTFKSAVKPSADNMLGLSLFFNW